MFREVVMAGLDPAIPMIEAQCFPDRDRRVKPCDDGESGHSNMR
jgi:hypothetical protein